MNKTTEICVSRLEQVRKEKGLTQTKLASKVGITKSAMSCYIRRKRIPRGDILVSIDYLAGISNVKKRQTNADRIRNMPDEELAEFLCRVKSDYQRMEHEFPSKEEHSKWEEWLRSEAE